MDEAARVMRLSRTSSGPTTRRNLGEARTHDRSGYGLEDEQIEQGLMTALDRSWLIMPPERPGKCQIAQAGFDAATAA